MLLYKKGHHKYFNSYVLKMIMDKQYTNVVNILQRYCRNKRLLKLRKLKDSSNATLLHYAAEYGNALIVKYLVDSKFKVDAQDCLGRSPLMLAVMGRHQHVIYILLKAKANVHLTDCNGKYPLQMIFQLESKNSVILKTLIEHANWRKIMKRVKPSDLTKKLNESNYTSVNALLRGNVHLMKFLLKCENEINDPKSITGGTLLHIAAQMGKLKIVKALIKCGANVDALDCENATPLFYLCEGNYENESAKFLKVLNLFFRRTALLNPRSRIFLRDISNILMYGSDAIIKIILQFCINLNSTDDKGNTVLHYLAQNHKVDLFKLLRGRAFKVEIRNNNGCTPLYKAVEGNALNNVKFLLENRADFNVANNSGETPLLLVFSRHRPWNKKSVDIFLEYGADPQTCISHLTTLNFNMFTRQVAMLEPCRITELFARAESIFARLAINEGLGTEINESTQSLINWQQSWIEYFNKCQLQVVQMKTITIHEKVPLFGFFTESEKKMIPYMRNEKFVSKLEKIIENFQPNSPYCTLLRIRFRKLMRIAELKEKAICCLCKLVNLRSGLPYYVAEIVIDYLSNEDMEILELM